MEIKPNNLNNKVLIDEIFKKNREIKENDDTKKNKQKELLENNKEKVIDLKNNALNINFSINNTNNINIIKKKDLMKKKEIGQGQNWSINISRNNNYQMNLKEEEDYFNYNDKNLKKEDKFHKNNLENKNVQNKLNEIGKLIDNENMSPWVLTLIMRGHSCSLT